MRAKSACGMCRAQTYGLLVRLKLITCVCVCACVFTPLRSVHELWSSNTAGMRRPFPVFRPRLLMLSHDWACKAALWAVFFSHFLGVIAQRLLTWFYLKCLSLPFSYFAVSRISTTVVQQNGKTCSFTKKQNVWGWDPWIFTENIRFWVFLCERGHAVQCSLCVSREQ